MNKMFVLASAGLLLLAPAWHNPLVAADMSTPSAPTTQTSNMPSTNVKMSDQDVTKAVQNAFAQDKDLSQFASMVTATTSNGVVTLSGTVNSDKVKSGFESKAAGVSGVNKVVNNITVTPSSTSTMTPSSK